MNKIQKKVMDDFNLSSEMIYHDLSKYYNYFNKKQKGLILKLYKSVEDYVNILYCFKFVNKHEYNVMAELLGIHISNVYEVFSQLGLGYTGTFEENEMQLNIKERYRRDPDRILRNNFESIREQIELLCNNIKKILLTAHNKNYVQLKGD